MSSAEQGYVKHHKSIASEHTCQMQDKQKEWYRGMNRRRHAKVNTSWIPPANQQTQMSAVCPHAHRE